MDWTEFDNDIVCVSVERKSGVDNMIIRLRATSCVRENRIVILNGQNGKHPFWAAKSVHGVSSRPADRRRERRCDQSKLIESELHLGFIRVFMPMAPSPALVGPPSVFPHHQSASFFQGSASFFGLPQNWERLWQSRASGSSSSPRNSVYQLSPHMAAAAALRRSSDYGSADTDCGEAAQSSDSDAIPTHEVDVLAKMEQLNRSNEEDSRSLTSRKTGSSGSRKGAREPTPPEDDEEDLWSVWGELIRNWEFEVKKRPTHIKDLVKRGIPQHFRMIAWQYLSNASVSSIHEVYSDYMRQSSVFEKVIQRDIPRTYPELDFFKDGGRGQSLLFNVIKAYSIHDKEVGYCQGSAFIVGLLLLQMPEEEAFAVLVRLMENYRLRELYKPAMTDLGLCMFQLECLVQEQMPDLYTHFNNMGFDTSMYASSWFLTLFTTTMPLDIANRIMDCFLVEGMDFIFCLAMAILQQARIELLRLDMEGMLKYFQREIKERYENDPDLLFAVANQVQLNPKRMKRLEKDYLAKRTKEQEEAVELRRLRTENRLLRQRIEYLEAESAALADRLIRGQVNLAQEAENCINIAHELSKLRDMNTDAHRKLEDAYETIRDLSCTRKENITDTATQVDDTSMIEHIHSLQQELIEAHTRQADSENALRDAKQRVSELESANKRLRENEPSEGIAGLQEELISVKMREAESSLALKEMRQRLAELEQYWAKYVHVRAFDPSSASIEKDSTSSDPPAQQPSPPLTSARARLAKITASLIGGSVDDGDSGITVRELEDQLMGVRIKEADTMAELKEMRQKVMELETQNHVCTNQLKRQDEEMRRVREEMDTTTKKRKELEAALRTEKERMVQRESELNEQCINERLKYSEAMQTVQDLRTSIAQMELKKAERWTQNQLRGSSVCDVDDDSNSHASGCSNGDALSLASDEMNALIADMTVRVPVLSDLAEESSATETDERPRSKEKHDGNDTTDSGLHLSDGQ
ncbi:unnamed protein product [Caenorhabditis auriculariae]|uniref:Rab-GAP TBC domain-containing protein n=1 Tax=Caenorhabditis auriculariae TaxID=2777116 RepID=A0A8S1GNP5_9PELO|nr:unnamed protein product [Caenorhabditis auriculariae]